ncbi:hypothetical protein Egran_04389 [Elaphomyces granulatus]|uniref:LYR motif-containing protein Cup1-like N-terminal domain-containing protein n=1 Tax=Elaphomyces granulatus TaxID=519963 RepID=A0A232LUQ0_9EURO|nr:hypothetical protein Egran_04389 [Elaphomyces granulatus]
MRVTDFLPPAQWRHLLRASLRECSYLPDPIARKYMHEHIIHRYRNYTDPKAAENLGIVRLIYLRRVAHHMLSVLKRANEGYLKPLEKVMFLSYGRIGKRRHQLLEDLLMQDIPPSTDGLMEMVMGPPMFEDGWGPPSILMDLLKSQHSNEFVMRSGVRQQVKTFAPKIPAENSWGRPLAPCRRRNIRKRWYRAALDSILPPLPEADTNILHGLLSGTEPWSPKRRRKAPYQSEPQAPMLTAQFLAEGPQKGHTFEKYRRGRPHKITHRLMKRLWWRIYHLVPRMKKDLGKNKQFYEWGSPKSGRGLAVAISDSNISDLFSGLDEKGKLTNNPREPAKIKI